MKNIQGEEAILSLSHISTFLMLSTILIGQGENNFPPSDFWEGRDVRKCNGTKLLAVTNYTYNILNINPFTYTYSII